MLGLSVQIGHEGYIASFREPIKFCTVCGTHFCGNYVLKSTCYFLLSERIYTYQNKMGDFADEQRLDERRTERSKRDDEAE